MGKVLKLPFKVEWAGNHCYRVMVDGDFVGFANRMANDTWCAFDLKDRRISPVNFKTPIKVGRYFRDAAALASKEPGNE